MPKLKSINPSNYRILGEVEISGPREVADKVKLANIATKEWGSLELDIRIHLLYKALSEFEERKSEFALLESREMGMPINEALVDYDGTLSFARWYLENAKQYLSPETTFESENEIHQVYREPLGVAAVIIPWNYPFLNFIWSSFQSLIAGNTVVLKHSEEIPLCGQLIESVMSRHLPKGVFSEVYGDGKVGKLLTRQDINLIHFVGSPKTGKFLYETAAKKFIKAVMELGGSAPAVIFEDVDIDTTAKSVCEYRLGNAGQWCDGLKRLLVHESIARQLVEKIAAIFAAKKIGVAEKETTEIGPLVAKRQLDLLAQQVEDAKAKGARVLTGGNSLESKLGGAFHQLTLLVNISDEMRVWKEEVFGPVLPVRTFKTEEEAVQLANDTMYGLGGYVHTQDPEKAARMVSAIKTGMVSVNGTNYTTPWNPFGGYKNSGIGREHGKYGFHEVTQVKVVARNK